MSSSWTWEPIQIPRLRAAQTRDAYNLHIAALEWDLDQPIVINSEKDIVSSKHWSEQFNPFEHQVTNLITFCRRAPVVLIADDVGLGKTISAGMILSELMARNKVKRALVLCPKILLPQWREELNSKFGISCRHAVGRNFDDVLSRNTSPVIVTTYASARTRFVEINNASFDMLILDEAHKLRNLYGGKEQPEFARNVRNAMKERVFKYVVMLTATPIQNKLWDIYSLLDCLTVAKGHDHPLGSPEAFMDRYVQDYRGRAITLYPKRRDEFRHNLSQYMVRTRRIDSNLPFPERIVRTCAVPATDEEIALIDLVSSLIGELNRLSQISLAQALMSSPEALLAQMDNMTERGSLPHSVLLKAKGIASNLTSTGKLSCLQELIKECSSKNVKTWRLLIFTTRKETQKAIGRFLQEQTISYGFIEGGQPHRNRETIERFTTDPPEIHVIVSTDAGAEGINLQAANVLVNYDLPWNPMIVEQRIGRIQRLASVSQYVQVLNFVLSGSVEESVVERLMKKLQMIAQAVGDIEGILEASGGQYEADTTFVEMIRKLVVNSLKGRDVTEALRKQDASIERAKDIYKEEIKTVEINLGRLGTMHETGPRMPALATVTPSINICDFVLRALTESGAHVGKAREGGYWVRHPGKPTEKIYINDDRSKHEDILNQLNDHTIRLYSESSTDFAKLVHAWVENNEHNVCELRLKDESILEEQAREWCDTIEGAVFQRVKIVSTKPLFRGKCVIRANSAVDHDRYGKMIISRIGSNYSGRINDKNVTVNPLTENDLDPRDVIANLEQYVQSAVTKDTDIAAFSHFYQHRKEEELKGTGDDIKNRKRVTDAFTPRISARLVALQGYRYEEVKAEVRFTLDGHGPYTGRFNSCPAIEQPTPKPTLISCGHTGKFVPDVCLGQCTKSGMQVLKHLLVNSEEPGKRKALKKYFTKCPISGKTILKDELKKSHVSGKKAAASLFKKSWLSGRLGLPDEFVTCELTSTSVLRDEILISDWSKKAFRKDESLSSPVSNRIGHESEYEKCELTEDFVLPDEIDISSYSGKRVRKDILIPSEKPPGRLGLQDELTRCEYSNMLLLKDEVDKSTVTGKWCDKALLEPSASSGKLAHRDELVACEVTNKRFLPNEVGKCSITHKKVKKTLLSRCKVSGKYALKKEMVKCEKTGVLALPDKLVECEETHKNIVPKEIGRCCITRKRVDKDILKKSVISGRLGIPDVMESCEFTNTPVLNDEIATSEYSNKIYRHDQSMTSPVSGKKGHKSEFVKCELTGVMVLPNEIGLSEISGMRVRSDMLHPSDKPPGRLGTPQELRFCTYSQKKLLWDEVDKSDVSGKLCDVDLLVPSVLSGGLAHKDEIVECQVSGKKILPSESGICHITGKQVIHNLLVKCTVCSQHVLREQALKSGISGKYCCPTESIRCSWEGHNLLPSEASECRLTGLQYSQKLLNPNNEFLVLRALLDNKLQGTDHPKLVSWLKKRGERPLDRLKHATVIQSPDKKMFAVCGELPRLWGLGKLYVGLLFQIRGPSQIIGRYTIGSRLRGYWRPKRDGGQSE